MCSNWQSECDSECHSTPYANHPIPTTVPGQRTVDSFNYARVISALAGYFSNNHDHVFNGSCLSFYMENHHLDVRVRQKSDQSFYKAKNC